jgi:glutathione S-transferase
MITVFGEGRGFRVVWLLEEMGLAYRLRPVDPLAAVEEDAEFLAVNPAGFIPAIQDGDVTMVESIAIIEYLLARYGPTRLAPDPHDPAFPAFQQSLHLGEAGLAAPIFFVVGARNFAPETERQNWSAGQALGVFESRLGLVTRQLARSPYLAGETFTAADISVTYALELAQRSGASPSARQSRPIWPAPADAEPISGHGNMSGHVGMGRRGDRSMTALALLVRRPTAGIGLHRPSRA